MRAPIIAQPTTAAKTKKQETTGARSLGNYPTTAPFSYSRQVLASNSRLSLKADPRAQPHLQWRLELRWRSAQHLRDRRAEVRIRRRSGQLRPLVVHQHRLRVEQIEDVGKERDLAGALAERNVVRRLEIDVLLERGA